MNSIILSLSVSAVWGKVWPILIAVLFFGLIIFIHELGHFTAAKLCGVRVNEFAMGMGPTVFKVTKNATQYSLRLFPIGGFVSMEGEEEDSEATDAFNKKPVWKRMVISLAGAFMNIVLGLVLMSVYLNAQPLMASTTISSFEPNAVSVQSGLQAGDRIVSMDGMSVHSMFDVSLGMMRAKNGVINMTVMRGGEKVSLGDVTFKTVEADGKIVTTYDFWVTPIEKNVLSVTKEAFFSTLSIAKAVWISLGDMLKGSFSLNEVSGPIGTVAVVGESASKGFSSLEGFLAMIMLMAFVTVNVGVFNLLPVPALDGCRCLFLLIELIIRRPLNRKYEGIINAVGFLCLIAFVMLVSLSDVARLIKG